MDANKRVESIDRTPRRLLPEERRKRLLDKAIDYFSEEGFEGGTRELARQLGITQPLIYRYFSTKADLINEVYQAVYLSQWQDDWARALQTRDRPVRERLLNFYQAYTAAIFNRRWMRIFFFAGLKGLDINTRYVRRVSDHILRPICSEMRAELGFDANEPLRQAEFELVWMMHGLVFYQGIRQHIYNLPYAIDHAFSVEVAVDMYVGKAREVIAAALADPDSPLARPESFTPLQQVPADPAHR
jgi:AcrR family transcriptional regulator